MIKIIKYAILAILCCAGILSCGDGDGASSTSSGSPVAKIDPADNKTFYGSYVMIELAMTGILGAEIYTPPALTGEFVFSDNDSTFYKKYQVDRNGRSVYAYTAEPVPADFWGGTAEYNGNDVTIRNGTQWITVSKISDESVPLKDLPYNAARTGIVISDNSTKTGTYELTIADRPSSVCDVVSGEFVLDFLVMTYSYHATLSCANEGIVTLQEKNLPLNENNLSYTADNTIIKLRETSADGASNFTLKKKYNAVKQL